MTSTGLADLLSNTWGILLVIVFFCGAIFFHELGHFLAAKWRGLKIERFSIGFGPRLFGWRGKDGVDYRISLLPLGGYVALPQLADMRAIEGESETPTDKLPPISYADKMIVAVAGPAFNVILAFVLAGIVWWVGYPQSAEQRTTTIGYVAPTLQLNADTVVTSPASKAGLKPGDRILAVDGKQVSDWADITKFIVTGSGRDDLDNPALSLTIKSEDAGTHEVLLLPELVEINRRSGKDIRMIGISPSQPLVVGRVFENSPAQTSGLLPGDHILTAASQHVYSIPQINEIITPLAGQQVHFGILREGKPMELSIQPEAVPITKPLLRLEFGEDANAFLEFIPKEASGDGVILFDSSPDLRKQFVLGSTVTAIDGQAVKNLGWLQTELASRDAKEVALTLLTDGRTHQETIAGPFTQEAIKPETLVMVGFNLAQQKVIAYPNPIKQVRNQIDMTLLFLSSLLSPNSDIGINQMSGAVGIGRVLHTFSIQDIRLALWFSVLLNINLAILNLLPIPVLDGGHMAFATISKILRRPLPVNFIASTQGAFMVLLLGLMLYVTFNDSMDWLGDHEAEQRYQLEKAYYIDPVFKAQR